MNEDYHDFLAALVGRDARFMVVGAHALAVHGYPRATVDIDVWIDPTPDNARQVCRPSPTSALRSMISTFTNTT